MNNRGFTLIEVLVAITIIGISFTVLFNLLYEAQKNLDLSEKNFNNFLIVDSAIKENNYEKIHVSEKEINILSVPLIEKIYEKDGVYLKLYQAK
jgi:prepilin-type N-terminal cleavage/methylation domain-containing protein